MLLGHIWTAKIRKKLRLLVFYAVVVDAAISGLEALVLSKRERKL